MMVCTVGMIQRVLLYAASVMLFEIQTCPNLSQEASSAEQGSGLRQHISITRNAYIAINPTRLSTSCILQEFGDCTSPQ